MGSADNSWTCLNSLDYQTFPPFYSLTCNADAEPASNNSLDVLLIQSWWINASLISPQWKELHVPTPVHVLTLVKLWEVRRLMECFCIHFSSKIASRLPSCPSMASWKDSNELETPCLPWHGTLRMPTYPMAWTFFCIKCDKHICYALLFTLRPRPRSSTPAFFLPKFDSGWVIFLAFSSSRLSLEDTQQWSQSLERLLESKCRLLSPSILMGWSFS